MRVRVRVLLLVSCVLTFALQACNLSAAPQAPSAGVPSASQAPAAAPTAQPAAPTLPPLDDAQAAVLDAFTKLDRSYPYRLTETSSSSSCAQQTRVVELAAANEFHAKWSGCLNGESISTHRQTWYLINGVWSSKVVAPPGAESATNIGDMVVTGLQSVKSAGKDTLNGIPMDVYTFNLSGASFDIKSAKVWIGVTDGLPHQAQASYTLNRATVNTLIVYEFGIAVTVQPPSP